MYTRMKLNERTERKHVRDSLNISRQIRDKINRITDYNGWRFLNYIMVQKEKMNMDKEKTEGNVGTTLTGTEININGGGF